MKVVNEKEFEELIKKDDLTIVDFSASWCMPCRMLKPILERVTEEFEDVDFFEIDIDDNEEIAKRYRIFSVPTLVCFKSGKKIDSLVGLNSYDDIVEFINNANEAEMEEE